MQKEPDYVPDGARLVQSCGLCAEDGHEISFAPDGIAALMKGHEESADGSTFMQAMYERMLFGNKAFKELFRARWKPARPHPVPLLGRQGPHRRGGHAHSAGTGRFG